MKIITIRYPIDVLLCFLYSGIFLPVVFLNIYDIIRIIFGLPFLFFIPGYLFLLCIFPNNAQKLELGLTYKIGISIGLSIALDSLSGIGLFYSPFGFNLISIMTSLLSIILICGLIAIYRWKKLGRITQFTFSLSSSDFKSKSGFDKILMLFLILAIILTLVTAIFISSLPRKQESFTEFYILGSSGKTIHYPKDLTIEQNSNITIGLINHEHKIVDYTIEIWLINQTLFYNNMTDTVNYTYHDMWFFDKISVTLNHFTADTNVIWQPQWEYLYNFSINKTGRYTLMFLLFTTPAPEFNKMQNYKDISATEIQNAYESIYIWLNISE